MNVLVVEDDKLLGSGLVRALEQAELFHFPLGVAAEESLRKSFQIGHIAIHPKDPNVVFATIETERSGWANGHQKDEEEGRARRGTGRAAG